MAMIGGLPLQGQVNLREAVAGKLSFTDPKSGKSYSLGSRLATLKVPARAEHLAEVMLVLRNQWPRFTHGARVGLAFTSCKSWHGVASEPTEHEDLPTIQLSFHSRHVPRYCQCMAGSKSQKARWTLRAAGVSSTVDAHGKYGEPIPRSMVSLSIKLCRKEKCSLYSYLLRTVCLWSNMVP